MDFSIKGALFELSARKKNPHFCTRREAIERGDTFGGTKTTMRASRPQSVLRTSRMKNFTPEDLKLGNILTKSRY